MAKIYKISGYILDVGGDYDEDHVEWLIGRYSDLVVRDLQVESVDIGEWDDDHPLNRWDCPVSECEKYFKEE